MGVSMNQPLINFVQHYTATSMFQTALTQMKVAQALFPSTSDAVQDDFVAMQKNPCVSGCGTMTADLRCITRKLANANRSSTPTASKLAS